MKGMVAVLSFGMTLAYAGADLHAQGSKVMGLAEPTSVDEPSTRSGSPKMTDGEIESLRASVLQCWNYASLTNAAAQVVVVVRVKMSPDARPDADSVRMVSSSGGSDVDAAQAYDAARRAIIRCGANGFDLPVDKYSQWRDIEITFNPESMWIK